MWIDTHCHLDKDYILEDIKDANLHNVMRLINIGIDKITSYKVIESTIHDSVYGAVGVHPLHLEDTSWIRSYATNNKIVAIGETGIDLFKSNNLVQQQESLQIHIDIANELDLPVILHVRNAGNEIKQFVKKINKGVIHCFTEGMDLAEYAIENNLYISFSGVITFKNASPNLLEVVKKIDIKHILLETDSPYLSPKRGKRNAPCNIPIIAETVSRIKNIHIDDIRRITTENAIKLFKIK